MKIHLRTEYVNNVAARELFIDSVDSIEFHTSGIAFVHGDEHYDIAMIQDNSFRFLGTEYDFCFVRS